MLRLLTTLFIFFSPQLLSLSSSFHPSIFSAPPCVFLSFSLSLFHLSLFHYLLFLLTVQPFFEQ